MHLRAIAYFLAAAAVSLLILLGQAIAQYGHFTRSGAGLCGLVEAKEIAAASVSGPKLLLVGGSSVTLGINAGMLEQRLGVPVRNFGLQAGLGPDVILSRARAALHPGDAVLLALEFPHYSYIRPTGPTADFLLGCGAAQLAEMGPLGAAAFFIGVSPLRWLDILRGRKTATAPTTLDARGDHLLTSEAFPPLPPEERERQEEYTPIPVSIDEDSRGATAIGDFIAWARRAHVRVYAAFPNTIYFPSYLESAGVQEIKDFYAARDVPMIGDITLGLLPQEDFYDTQYHLGPEGIALRTTRLADEMEQDGSAAALRSALGEGTGAQDPDAQAALDSR